MDIYFKKGELLEKHLLLIVAEVVTSTLNFGNILVEFSGWGA